MFKKHSSQNQLQIKRDDDILVSDIWYPYTDNASRIPLGPKQIIKWTSDYILHSEMLNRLIQELNKNNAFAQYQGEYSDEYKNGLPTKETLRHVYNHQLPEQLQYESLESKMITLQILIDLFRFQPGKKQHFLSLGSGVAQFELYLLSTFFRNQTFSNLHLYCLDISETAAAIVKFYQELFNRVKPKTLPVFQHITPLVADMTEVPLPNGSIDQIYCLMSLHWVADFKKAISEMKRILDPQGERRIYLCLSASRQAVCGTVDGLIHPFEIVKVAKVLDELENQGFSIRCRRTCYSNAPIGQGGQPLNREFIMAELEPPQISWRTDPVPW